MKTLLGENETFTKISPIYKQKFKTQENKLKSNNSVPLCKTIFANSFTDYLGEKIISMYGCIIQGNVLDARMFYL